MRRNLLLAVAIAACAISGSAAAQASAPDGARVTAPRSDAVDPGRFDQRPADIAYGAYQRGYYVTALNLATPLAIAGDAAAQTLVAEIYSRGLGVRQDIVKATEWYEQAAAQGVAQAQFQLAMILLDGGPEFRDPERAFALLEQAADAGDRMAQFNFAQMLTARQPTPAGMERAVRYYRMAADLGLADAQYAMAQVYAAGAGGLPVDPGIARTWLERAAKQNYDTAQIELGAFLIEGIGGERNQQAGFAWLMRAALGGNVAAENRIAKLYLNGIGVEPDSVLAAAWYLRARQAGLIDPLMEDHLGGLTNEELREASLKASVLR